MTAPGTKGRLAFFALLLQVLVLALVAYQFSGTMGIEERFTRALSLENNGNEPGTGSSGLALEGSPLLYGIVLGGLAIGIVVAWRYFRI